MKDILHMRYEDERKENSGTQHATSRRVGQIGGKHENSYVA
jgi:hypothetical protein